MICVYCNEEILPGERADNKGSDFHPECLFRAVAGSVAHLQRRCSCFVPGSREGDPPGLTRRQAAAAALAYYYAQNPFGPEDQSAQSARDPAPTYTLSPDGASITCRRCGKTSHNLNDVRQLYCGWCHTFHEVRKINDGTPIDSP